MTRKSETIRGRTIEERTKRGEMTTEMKLRKSERKAKQQRENAKRNGEDEMRGDIRRGTLTEKRKERSGTH